MVSGRLESSTGVIDAPIKGKKSVTRYAVVQYTDSLRYGTITTVDLFPITGRQHQLRKHLMSVGHPILGNTHTLSLTHTSFHTHALSHILSLFISHISSNTHHTILSNTSFHTSFHISLIVLAHILEHTPYDSLEYTL